MKTRFSVLFLIGTVCLAHILTLVQTTEIFNFFVTIADVASLGVYTCFLTVLTVFVIYDLVTTVVSTAVSANLLFEASRLSTHFPSLHFIEFEPHHRNFHALRRESGFFLPTKIHLKRNSQEDGKKAK